MNANITTSTPVSMSVGSGGTVNMVIASGGGGGGPTNVLVKSTAEWNAQTTLIARNNVVYVYSDHLTDDNGNPVPGFKVGDGTSYLIDMAFNDDIAMEHIADTTVHVTDAERAFWNNKVTAYLNAGNLEELVLTKE